MFEIILGQVPEAIYFSLFMILIKEFKTRRVIFTLFMFIVYFGLKAFLPYDLKFQFLFIFGSYVSMKLLYGKKVQITDVFLFAYAMFILVVSGAIGYAISFFTLQSILLGNLISKVIAFCYLIFRRNSIQYVYKKYRNNWNRKPNLKIKSLTVRNASLVAFNLMLVVIGIVVLNKEFFMTLLF